MNRIYPTPTGFVLISDQDLPPHQVAHMVEKLNDVTGVSWVIIPKTEESTEAKYIHAGIKFEKTMATISKAMTSAAKTRTPSKSSK